MNAWAQAHNIKKVKMIPDGSGEFTRQMGYLVDKDNLGFPYQNYHGFLATFAQIIFDYSMV